MDRSLPVKYFLTIVFIFHSSQQANASDFSTLFNGEFLDSLREGMGVVQDLNGEKPIDPELVIHQSIIDCIAELNPKGVVNSEGARCGDLPIGLEVNVNVAGLYPGLGMRQRYRIERLTEGDYKIGINPFFWERRESLFSTSAELRAQMQERIESCFQRVGVMPVVGGRTFSFEINSYAPRVSIGRSDDPTHRSNVSEYNPNISCATVMHEVMHILGLVDEYHEHTGDFPYRRLGEVNNIMYAQTQAFEESYGSYEVTKCETI